MYLWRMRLGATVLSRATSLALSLLAAPMLSSLGGIVPASAAVTYLFTVTPSPISWGEDVTLSLQLLLNPDPAPAGYFFESIGFLGGTVTFSPNPGVFNITPGTTAEFFQSTANYHLPTPFVFDPSYSVTSLSYEEIYHCILSGPCVPVQKIVDVEVADFTFHDTNSFTIIRPPAVVETPLPAALPLFATGLGVLGLLGWRRKKKTAALAV